VYALTGARGIAAELIELDLSPAWIDAEAARITQIVENLLGNALKHTPVGRRIRVVVRDLGSVAELRVEDEGFGIDAELLPNVFEPFRQGAQGLDRSAGGLGLGLTLVQRLTELHGGSIEARSDGADRGSAFVLWFPVCVLPPVTPSAGLDARAQPQGNRTRRLLIVEDNIDARQTLRALLETLGHEVQEAGDGEAGVAAALALEPDVVFVDIGLPYLDGYEVARRIRAAKPAIRLVALTGYGQQDDVQRSREAGFDEHLLKPASLEGLRAAINAAT
jgi:CheY-like chemotaxis protein/anti-sigma regulatory factor (Ser/Thr protein kinase)